jgi:hypothetical protein
MDNLQALNLSITIWKWQTEATARPDPLAAGFLVVAPAPVAPAKCAGSGGRR